MQINLYMCTRVSMCLYMIEYVCKSVYLCVYVCMCLCLHACVCVLCIASMVVVSSRIYYPIEMVTQVRNAS